MGNGTSEANYGKMITKQTVSKLFRYESFGIPEFELKIKIP